MNRLRQQLILEHLEDRRLLATCHVTRLGDLGAGAYLGGGHSRGDLRYCINKANSESGPDVIDFSVTGTISLTAPLPEMASEIEIQGPGANNLTIRRDTGGEYRIFSVAAGATVRICDVTATNGLAGKGGGVLNRGKLTLCRVKIMLNSGGLNSGASGGGIYNEAALSIFDSTISGNSVIGTGGGVRNLGTMIVENSVISGNTSSQGSGGGVFQGPNTMFILTNSFLVGNTARDAGGGIANKGDLTAHYSIFSDNEASGDGGGIANEGDLTVDYSTVSNNKASGDGGGGIYNSGHASIRNSAVFNNAAEPNSTSGGGIYNRNSFMVIDSTISMNTAATDGGGIYNNAELTIVRSTIAANSAGNRGGGIETGSVFQGTSISNTIVAVNSASSGPDVKDWVTGSGFNLIGNSSGGFGYSGTDILDSDPKFGPLMDNGGPTSTMALLPGSPAIDAGDNIDTPEWDQRGPGFPRIVNGTIDIGAFEVQATPVPAAGVVSPLLAAILTTAVFDTDELW